MEPFPVIKRVWQNNEKRFLDEIEKTEKELLVMRGRQMDETTRQYPEYSGIPIDEWPDKIRDIWDSWEEKISNKEGLIKYYRTRIVETERDYYSDLDPVELRIMESKIEFLFDEMGTPIERAWGMMSLYSQEQLEHMASNSQEMRGNAIFLVRNPDNTIPVNLVSVSIVNEEQVRDEVSRLASQGIEWIEEQERMLLEKADEATLLREFIVEATNRFETKIKEFNFKRYWDLRVIMSAFPHLKLQDGYTLDACLVGDLRNAQRRLYVYKMDSQDVYYPGPDHHNTQNDVFEDKDEHVLYGGGPGDLYEVKPPIPFRDGQVIEDTISFPAFETVPSISEYLDVDFTPETIWEALLLVVEATSYLPHRWHGGYENGNIIVDSLSLIQSCRGCLADSMIEFLLNVKNYYPEIKILDNHRALVIYCRWSDHFGLSRITQMARFDGRRIWFEEQSAVVVAEYDDGLIF